MATATTMSRYVPGVPWGARLATLSVPDGAEPAGANPETTPTACACAGRGASAQDRSAQPSTTRRFTVPKISKLTAPPPAIAFDPALGPHEPER